MISVSNTCLLDMQAQLLKTSAIIATLFGVPVTMSTFFVVISALSASSLFLTVCY